MRSLLEWGDEDLMSSISIGCQFSPPAAELDVVHVGSQFSPPGSPMGSTSFHAVPHSAVTMTASHLASSLPPIVHAASQTDLDATAQTAVVSTIASATNTGTDAEPQQPVEGVDWLRIASDVFTQTQEPIATSETQTQTSFPPLP